MRLSLNIAHCARLQLVAVVFLVACSGAKTVETSAGDQAPNSGSQQAVKPEILRLTSLPKVSGAKIVVTPNPVSFGADGSYPAVTFTWKVPHASKVEIHMQKADGILFAQGDGSGNALTGAWVQPISVFYFQDVTKGHPGETVSIVRVAICKDCSR